LYTDKPEAFTLSSLFTQKLLHADAFTKPFYTENPLHREPVAHRLMMMMMMMIMMMEMEMEVASYDPAFQTELLSASDLHNGPSKAAKLLPGVAPLWRWFSWAWSQAPADPGWFTQVPLYKI